MIEVFKDIKREWRFRVKARNGRILCHSEGYKSKRNALKGIVAAYKGLIDSDTVKVLE